VVLHWSLSNIFGMSLDSADNKNVWWAASDLGWVVGHSYICYAPLLAGLTTVLYEGKPVGTPDAAQFFRYISIITSSFIRINNGFAYLACTESFMTTE